MYRIAYAYSRASPKTNLSSKRYTRFACTPVFVGKKAVPDFFYVRSCYVYLLYFCVPIFILLIISNFMLSIFSSHMVVDKSRVAVLVIC